MVASSSQHQVRKMIAGLCMIAAPLLLLAGTIVSPALDSNAGAQVANAAAHPDRWYIAMLLFLLGWVAFVPAVLGLVHMLRERNAAYGLVGGALATLGILASIGYVAIGFVIWQMAVPAADTAAMTALLDRVMNTAGTFVPFYLMGFGVAIGALVLMAGLARERIAPAWITGPIAISALAFGVGMATYSMPFLIAAAALLFFGLGSLGSVVLRESLEDWEHTPEFRGIRPMGAH